MPERKVGEPAYEGTSDRVIIDLDDKQSAVFLEALANPPAPARALRDLMFRPSLWIVDKT